MYMIQSKYQKAIHSFKVCLRIQRRKRLEAHALQTQVYIAKALMFDAQLDEAERKCTKLLPKILQRYHEADRLSDDYFIYGGIISEAQDVLASNYNQQGRHDETVRVLESKVARVTFHHGPDALETMESKVVLSRALVDNGEIEHAEKLILATLESVEYIFGADHKMHHNSEELLTSIYMSQHKYEEAETLMHAQLARFKALRDSELMEENTSTWIAVKGNLANLCFVTERFAEAEEIFRDVLVRMKQSNVGLNFINTMESNLISSLQRQHKKKDTLSAAATALNRRRTLYGEESRETWLAYYMVGDACRVLAGCVTCIDVDARSPVQVSSSEQAMKYLRRAFKNQQTFLGDDHVDTQTTKQALKMLVQGCGVDDAEAGEIEFTIAGDDLDKVDQICDAIAAAAVAARCKSSRPFPNLSPDLVEHGGSDSVTDFNSDSEETAAVPSAVQESTLAVYAGSAQQVVVSNIIQNAVRDGQKGDDVSFLLPFNTSCELGTFPTGVQGYWSLVAALGRGDMARVHDILQAAGNGDTIIDFSELDIKGNNVLILAAHKGLTAVTIVLLEATTADGAPAIDLNAKNAFGESALTLCASNGHAEVVKALLRESGNNRPALDLSTCDSVGNTALIRAAYHGHAGVVAALVSVPAVDLDAANFDGCTALICAAYNGHVEIMDILLDHGVNINVTNKTGETALICGIFKGRMNVARVLLSATGSDGAAVDINVARNNGNTALTYAVRQNNCEIVRALIGAVGKDGARVDLNAVDEYDNTPLNLACSQGFTLLVSELIEAVGKDGKGADLYYTRRDGHTPLKAAISSNHAPTLQTLLDAKITVTDLDLLYAKHVVHKSPVIVNMLQEYIPKRSCAACKKERLYYYMFAKAQLKKPSSERRCADCVLAGNGVKVALRAKPGDSSTGLQLMCSACAVEKASTQFSKAQRGKKDARKCIACISQVDTEQKEAKASAAAAELLEAEAASAVALALKHDKKQKKAKKKDGGVPGGEKHNNIWGWQVQAKAKSEKESVARKELEEKESERKNSAKLKAQREADQAKERSLAASRQAEWQATKDALAEAAAKKKFEKRKKKEIPETLKDPTTIVAVAPPSPPSAAEAREAWEERKEQEALEAAEDEAQERVEAEEAAAEAEAEAAKANAKAKEDIERLAEQQACARAVAMMAESEASAAKAIADAEIAALKQLAADAKAAKEHEARVASEAEAAREHDARAAAPVFAPARSFVSSPSSTASWSASPSPAAPAASASVSTPFYDTSPYSTAPRIAPPSATPAEEDGWMNTARENLGSQSDIPSQEFASAPWFDSPPSSTAAWSASPSPPSPAAPAALASVSAPFYDSSSYSTAARIAPPSPPSPAAPAFAPERSFHSSPSSTPAPSAPSSPPSPPPPAAVAALASVSTPTLATQQDPSPQQLTPPDASSFATSDARAAYAPRSLSPPAHHTTYHASPATSMPTAPVAHVSHVPRSPVTPERFEPTKPSVGVKFCEVCYEDAAPFACKECAKAFCSECLINGHKKGASRYHSFGMLN